MYNIYIYIYYVQSFKYSYVDNTCKNTTLPEHTPRAVLSSTWFDDRRCRFRDRSRGARERIIYTRNGSPKLPALEIINTIRKNASFRLFGWINTIHVPVGATSPERDRNLANPSFEWSDPARSKKFTLRPVSYLFVTFPASSSRFPAGNFFFILTLEDTSASKRSVPVCSLGARENSRVPADKITAATFGLNCAHVSALGSFLYLCLNSWKDLRWFCVLKNIMYRS